MLRDGSEPIPERMRELASRVKHVFFMVDEITGDSAGAEFLAGLGRQLEDLGLADERYGFNTKVIVADASIVDKNVIEQHLAEAKSEPDKIFFRAAAAGVAEPLTLEKFRYRAPPGRDHQRQLLPGKHAGGRIQGALRGRSVRSLPASGQARAGTPDAGGHRR